MLKSVAVATVFANGADVLLLDEPFKAVDYVTKRPLHEVLLTLWNGVPGVETRLPLLYSEGVLKGRIDLNRFVRLTATNAAKLYALYPRMGTIAIGADADVVISDENATTSVTNAMLHHACDYTPYEGMELSASPALPCAAAGRGTAMARSAARRGTARSSPASDLLRPRCRRQAVSRAGIVGQLQPAATAARPATRMSGRSLQSTIVLSGEPQDRVVEAGCLGWRTEGMWTPTAGRRRCSMG